MSGPTPGKKYIGKIVPGPDPAQRGRYVVQIPEAMPHMPETSGLLLPNQCGNNISSSDKGTYGSYMPLQAGTTVMIECMNDNWESGRIVGTVGDAGAKSEVDPITNKPRSSSGDRDEQYTVVTTPNGTRIFVTENSSTEPNSVFIMYKNTEAIVRINPEGIHIQTDKNYTKKVKIDEVVEIVGNSSIKIGGKWDLLTEGDINVKSSGTILLNGAGGVVIQGPASPAGTAVPDLTPGSGGGGGEGGKSGGSGGDSSGGSGGSGSGGSGGSGGGSSGGGGSAADNKEYTVNKSDGSSYSMKGSEVDKVATQSSLSSGKGLDKGEASSLQKAQQQYELDKVAEQHQTNTGSLFDKYNASSVPGTSGNTSASNASTTSYYKNRPRSTFAAWENSLMDEDE